MRRRTTLMIVVALAIGFVPGSPATGDTTTVTITNYAFSPDPAVITRGDSAMWFWQDGTHRIRDDNEDLRVIR